MESTLLAVRQKRIFARSSGYIRNAWTTRVKELLNEGINVCFAQDSINHPWYPLGNGNMMNILDNGIHLSQVASYDELETAFNLITHNGAKAMMIEHQYGLEVGKPANFIVLNESSVFEAIRKRVEVLSSVRNGNFLFRRSEPEYDIALELHEEAYA